MASQDDRAGLYDHLRHHGVEFYVTDPDCFEVDAFVGWQLRQYHFEIQDDDIEGVDYWDQDDAYYGDDGWEEYD
jgi:hypothetical protein